MKTRSLHAKRVANAPSDFDPPFVVQLPWDDPLIFPGPESLIRRSLAEPDADAGAPAAMGDAKTN